jgi:hypothetical protein
VSMKRGSVRAAISRASFTLSFMEEPSLIQTIGAAPTALGLAIRDRPFQLLPSLLLFHASA